MKSVSSVLPRQLGASALLFTLLATAGCGDDNPTAPGPPPSGSDV